MKRWLGIGFFIGAMLGTGETHATFLPENEIRQTGLPTGEPNINESEFRQIIAKLQGLFAPIVQQHGGRFHIQGDWRSDTLNAGATQMLGNWVVRITGALARRPELTPDGFTLILCHEIGHHLGGFPLGQGDPFNGRWSAAEGEADYYATHVCNRRIWGRDVELNASFRLTADPEVRAHCDQVWSSVDEQNLCYRTGMAVRSLILTMATLKNVPPPSFATPDSRAVERTNVEHPEVQCRMDTSLAGALCPQAFADHIIPGKRVPGGVDSLAAEEQAAANSCTALSGYQIGLRPKCWFKPRM